MEAEAMDVVVEDPKAVKAELIRRGKCLVEAAGSGHLEELLALLEMGVSVDAEEYNKSQFYASEYYATPLKIACEENHIPCVSALIEYGADVNARDKFGVTAMHVCAEKGNYMCLKVLIDAGADCNVATKYAKKGCYAYLSLVNGTTPLHLAAAGNYIDCVKELIHSGADYNTVDERGRTSLYIAAQLKYEECVLAHLRNAVGKDILSLPSFESGDTPLHFAVRFSMVESVKELLNLGSDPNHVNHSGLSPLHYAVCYNLETKAHAEEILQLLILHGYNTNVNLRDSGGYTPLHYVCFNVGSFFVRRPNLAHILLAYGADPNIHNQRGMSIIENEIRSPYKDQIILNTVVRSLCHPPKLNRAKLFLPAPPSPRVLMPYRRIRLEELMQEHRRGDSQERRLCTTVKTKCQWYRNVTSKPRSLQHYCRYNVRKLLGCRSLRYIKDLPIPTRVQQYLLLEWDDDVEV